MTGQEFSERYLPLGEGLFRVAYALLGAEADAEDALQDLYVKLWNDRDTLDHVHNPRAYSITLLRNLCLDRLRAKRRSAARPLEADVAAEGSADARTLEREQRARLVRAIEALPASQRTVVELRLLQGLSYEEIAEKTALSPLSLRVLLARARKTIKSQL